MTRKFCFFGCHFKASVLARMALWVVPVLCQLASAGVQAQAMREIPPGSIIQNAAYPSTALLLNPCLNAQAIAPREDSDTRQQFIGAGTAFPPETCSNPELVEKIFRVRFLQYALLTLVNDPWNFGTKIAAQEQAFSLCRDTHCLERELDSTINTLEPLYVNASDPKWPSGTLCIAEPIEVLPSVLTKKARKEISTECGGVDSGNTAISACNSSHGKLVVATCRMQGNQVNTPQWLFRERKAGKKLLLYTSDGPFGVLESVCNGMPDLITTARMNAGEHSYTYYRFDGSRYQPVYGYTAMSIGNGDDGYDFFIAQGAGVIKNSVVCR